MKVRRPSALFLHSWNSSCLITIGIKRCKTSTRFQCAKKNNSDSHIVTHWKTNLPDLIGGEEEKKRLLHAVNSTADCKTL